MRLSTRYLLVGMFAIAILVRIAMLQCDSDPCLFVTSLAHGCSWVGFFYLIGKMVRLGIKCRIALAVLCPTIICSSWYGLIQDQIRGPFILRISDAIVLNGIKFLGCAVIVEMTIRIIEQKLDIGLSDDNVQQ